MMIPRWLVENQNNLIIRANDCVHQNASVTTKKEDDHLHLSDNANHSSDAFHIWVEGSLSPQSLSIEWRETSVSNVTLWIKPKLNQSTFSLALTCQNEANVSLNVVVLGSVNNFALSRSVIVNKQASLSMKTSVLSKGVLSIKETLDLVEVGANFNHQTLVIGSQTDNITVSQNVHHQAKETESLIHNALVGNDASKIKFDIYGTIDKYQAKSKCFQHSKGIILGEQSWIEVDPKLIINEFDVEAGHGAAIGQMNPDELYYLTSRGLTETKAKQLIIHGLTTPYVDALPSKDSQSYIQHLIARKMGGR